jgi:hypothetical protein
MHRSSLLFFALATPVLAKVPRDAPYCAASGAKPIFVAPMGEPFRGASGQPYPSVTWFAAADRNADGAIDRAEFVADADRFFRTLDRDHDGRLVPEEVIAYEAEVAPEISVYAGGVRGRELMPPDAFRPHNGESDYHEPLGAGRFGWLNIPEPVAATDGDVDRVITRKEFAEAAGRRFEALDPDGKGKLTLAALGKTPEQQAIEGPCRPRPKRTRKQEDDERRQYFEERNRRWSGSSE